MDNINLKVNCTRELIYTSFKAGHALRPVILDYADWAQNTLLREVGGEKGNTPEVFMPASHFKQSPPHSPRLQYLIASG